MIRTLLKFFPVLFLLLPLFSIAEINKDFSSFTPLSVKKNYNCYQVDTEAPSAPKNLVASQTFGTTTDLSWTESTDNVGVTAYEIYSGANLIATINGPANWYRVTKLDNITNYTFTIKAKDAAGNISASSNQVSITTLDSTRPTTPSNLTASELTENSVKLSWEPSTDNVAVTAYDLYNSDTFWKRIDAPATSYTVALSQGYTYRFSLKARDAAGNVSFSGIQVMVKPIDTTPPTVPKNLVASKITETSANLSWSSSTDAESAVSYEIYKGTALIGTSTTTNFAITGLVANNAYLFSVKSKDAIGNLSAPSLALLVETSDTIPPTAPGSLTASEITTTSVNFNWTASTDNREVTGYDVYINGGLQTTVKTTNYRYNFLSPNGTYLFKVIARDLAGNASAESNTVTIKPDPAPPAYCVSQGFSQVIDEYITRVQIGTIDRKSNVSNISYTDATSYVTELKKGETYSITITPKEWISGKTQFGLRYAVYIDYNGDYDFYDAGELVWNQEVTTQSPVRGTFVVPANAVTAKTRIRVALRSDGIGIPSACGDYTNTYNYGETEDYSANIIENATAPNAPDAPTNLTASATTWTTTSLTWTPPANNQDITNYEIYKENILIGTSATANFSVTGLVQGKTYLLTVKAKNSNGLISKSSLPVTVTTPTDTTPPTTPQNIITQELSATKVTITWDPSTNNGGGISYLVYSDDVLLSTVTTTKATIIGLSGNKTYKISIQATDEFGHLSPKANMSFTSLKDIVPPTAPTNLNATETTTVSTKLSWTDATDNEDVKSYIIYMDDVEIWTLSSDLEPYLIIPILKEGTTYSFRVVAVDAANNRTSSEALLVTTVAIPKYCKSNSVSKNYDFISQVDLGTINQTIPYGSAYANTGFSTILNPGQENTITVSASKSGSKTTPSNIAVWIDLNGDKDFEDAGELIWSTTFTEAFAPLTKKFTIPITAKKGKTIMRIIVKPNGIPTSCENVLNGQMIDYTIDITRPIIEFEAPTIPKNLVASNTTTSTTELSWTASTDNIAVTEYEIYEGSKLIGTTNLTNFTVTSLSLKTAYTFSVKAKDYAKNVSEMSVPVSVTTVTLSVDDHEALEKNNYILYPNPTKHNLLVKRSTNNPTAFRISNMQGKSVLEGHLNENNIDVSNLSSGIYIIELNDGEKNVTKKFIKN